MLSMRRGSVFLVFLGLLLLCNTGPCLGNDLDSSPGKNEKFNVVLIILDALRPDHLKCYGYPEDTSPTIDALSKDGIIFKNAFCQFPLTLPSVVSIFTSLYPSSHQIKHALKDRMPDRVCTLAQILRIYGYSTAWFGSKLDPQTGAAPGLLKGFDGSYRIKNHWSAKEVSSWVKKHYRERFFITVHSYQTHEQFFPFSRFDNDFFGRVPKAFLEEIEVILRKAWTGMQEKLETDPGILYEALGKEWVEQHRQLMMRPYSKKAGRDLINLGGTPERRAFLHHLLKADPTWTFLRSLNTQRMGYLLRLLDSAIVKVDDDLVGQLVDMLKKKGVYDKTIIIITADHGNEFKEHGHVGHGCYLYDEALKVPLVFLAPGLKSGVKIDQLVESVDILPTVCDLLGIPVPHQAQGVSLRGLWEGGSGKVSKQYVISESIGTGLVAIRSSRWKLIMDEKSGEAKELYDMEKDPRELQDIMRSNPGVVKDLRKDYISKVNGLPLYQDNTSEFIPGIDTRTRERIKETGYW